MGKTVTTASLPKETPPLVNDQPEPDTSLETDSLVTGTLVTGDLNDPPAETEPLADTDTTYTVMPKTGRHIQFNGKVIPLTLGETTQVSEHVYRFLLGLDEVDAVPADEKE